MQTLKVYQVQGEPEQRRDGINEYCIFKTKWVWHAENTGQYAVAITEEVRRLNGQKGKSLQILYAIQGTLAFVQEETNYQ